MRSGPDVHQFTSSRLPAYDRGFEFGRRFPQQIRATIGFYRDLLARCPNPDIDLTKGGALALDSIERFSSATADELRGISDGAGLPVAEIAGINARTELLALADPDGTVECSTIVSAPASGVVRGAQTWDWYLAMADGWLQWTIPLPDGRMLSTVTEYGVLGKIGVNDSGLGLLFSILHHEADGNGRVGVPVHVLARTVLEQARDVASALEVIRGAELSASSTFTLLDPTRAAAAELFPHGLGIVYPNDEWLVHSNHFLSNEGAPGCRDHATGINSPTRLRILTEHVRSGAEATDAGLLTALTGHDPAGRLCVHARPDATEATLATVVIDTGVPSLAVWRGWPCAANQRGPSEVGDHAKLITDPAS